MGLCAGKRTQKCTCRGVAVLKGLVHALMSTCISLIVIRGIQSEAEGVTTGVVRGSVFTPDSDGARSVVPGAKVSTEGALSSQQPSLRFLVHNLPIRDKAHRWPSSTILVCKTSQVVHSGRPQTAGKSLPQIICKVKLGSKRRNLTTRTQQLTKAQVRKTREKDP
jgi:hypothetical protein